MGGSPSESLLTSTGMEAGIQFSQNHAFKVDPGVLPQHRALEDSSADATGLARSGANRDTWGQIVRGETDLGRTCRRRSRDTRCLAMRASSFNILTADGTVQDNLRGQCCIVHRPADRRARMQPHHMPAARTAPLHGTQGRALLPHPRAGASCRVNR